MTEYLVTLTDGQTFLMSADTARAESPISANWHYDEDPDDWQGTPYQCADATHSAEAAADLVAYYFAVEDGDCDTVATVTEQETKR